MARQFLDKKTQPFYFLDANNEEQRYVLIRGDEVNTLTGNASKGPEYSRVEYRGRTGQWKEPKLTNKRSLEFYFLDVGQGDAAFFLTPNDTKVLVDGGLKDRALAFLIWKYRLDQPGRRVTIDHLFLSHADKDHVAGLIRLLKHPRIDVKAIHHNGIGIFDSGFTEDIGNRSADDRLTTIHDSLTDLDGLDLASAVFKKWIDAVKESGASYGRLDNSIGVIDLGDPDITCEIIGPILEPDGQSLKWFSTKSKTINGNSLVFRLSYNRVRAFFSGDLNERGSEHILAQPNLDLKLNAHIFKAPHHGSHDFSGELFSAVNPMITVVSSGETPDHGHPRADFLAAIGRASRGDRPLLFSTEIAALFVDAGDPDVSSSTDTQTDIDDLALATLAENAEARKRFKKLLPGIINIRTNGEEIYAFRRVQSGYQWVSYDKIKPSL